MTISPRRPSGGFTLIEIIVVILLIALALTVVAVSVGSGLAGARVRGAGKDLVAALRYTRGQAIVKREERVLKVDVDKRTFQAPGHKPVEFPRNVEVKLLTARDELLEDGVGQIRFFPDGSSNGGRVTLIYGQAEWKIEVAWLTGQVTLGEL